MSIYTKDNIKLPDTVIGDFTYGTPIIARAYSGCKLEIGKFCSIANNVQIVFWGKHSMVDITTYPFNILHGIGFPPVQCTEVKGEDIYIGNDVWLANNCLIMQGAYIEDGAVIGANSVVAGHVPAYSLVVGNPAKKVKQRFSDEDITKLLEMRWFDWDINVIKQHLQLISSPNISQLYEIWCSTIKGH